MIDIFTFESGRVAFISPPPAINREVFGFLYGTIANWLSPTSDCYLPVVSLNQLKEHYPSHYDLLLSFLFHVKRRDRAEPFKIEDFTWQDIKNLIELTAKYLDIGEIPEIVYPESLENKEQLFNPNKYIKSSGDPTADLLADLIANGIGDIAVELFDKYDLETILRINYRARQNKYLAMPELRDAWVKQEKRQAEIDLLTKAFAIKGIDLNAQRHSEA